MESNALLLSLLSGLMSGLIVLVVSNIYQHSRESRKERLAVLGELMGNRHGLTAAGGEDANTRFFHALNLAYVVFHKSKPVVEALNDFKKNKGQTAKNVTRLLRMMMKDLGFDISELDDSFFDEPFAPGQRTGGS